MANAINIKNLTKYYISKGGNKKTALNSLDMSVPEGSIFGLLGPNGAGKSTLINIIAGTVIKTSGDVEITGINIDDKPKAARSLIGVVPQEIVIDSFFSLYQTLEFTAGYFGIRPKYRKTNEILKALSLYDKRHSLPKQLSGGMKRRFLIAKAMVHSPKILILDEPTAGVDIELRNQLWHYVKELNKKGATIIITTHYLAEAQELCDEIAFINHGRIIKQDSKHNLLKNLGSRHLEVEFEQKVNSTKFTKFIAKSKFDVIDENKIRFSLNAESKNNFNDILSGINSTNQQIRNLHVTQPDLEDIFHKIVIKNK